MQSTDIQAWKDVENHDHLHSEAICSDMKSGLNSLDEEFLQ